MTWALALGSLAIAVTAGAQADRPSASLDWRAPEECIASDDLAGAVAAQLGAELVDVEHAELRASAWVEHDTVYRATLRLETRSGVALGERVLESSAPDCGPLAERVVVVLAIMLNVRREDLPPEAPVPLPIANDLRAVIGAHAAVNAGLLPLPALELVAEAGFGRLHVFEITAEVGWAWTSMVPIDRGVMQTSALSARVSGALLFGNDDAELAVRLSVGGGLLFAGIAGIAVDRPSVIGGFLEVRTGGQLSLRIAGPLWLELRAELGLLPYRLAIELRTLDEMLVARFTPTPVLGSFGLGPRLVF